MSTANPATYRILVYAAPHISEELGVRVLSSPTHTGAYFNCMDHCLEARPEFATSISIIKSLIYQAQNIYLKQAAFDPSTYPSSIGASVQRVQKFIDTLQTMPEDSQCYQILPWATFVAASDCLLEEHKIFFERHLLRHYARSGFSNLLWGMKHLSQIWARTAVERWTGLLPRAKLFMC